MSFRAATLGVIIVEGRVDTASSMRGNDDDDDDGKDEEDFNKNRFFAVCRFWCAEDRTTVGENALACRAIVTNITIIIIVAVVTMIRRDAMSNFIVLRVFFVKMILVVVVIFA
jgi:hypothetical protein